MSKVSNWNHLHSAGGTQQGHHNTRHDKKQAIFPWREQCTRGSTGSREPGRSGPGRPGSAAGRRQQRRPAESSTGSQQPRRWQIFTGPGCILAGNKINRLQPAQQQPGRERSGTTGRNAQPWKIKQQPGRAAEDRQQGGSSAGQQPRRSGPGRRGSAADPAAGRQHRRPEEAGPDWQQGRAAGDPQPAPWARACHAGDNPYSRAGAHARFVSRAPAHVFSFRNGSRKGTVAAAGKSRGAGEPKIHLVFKNFLSISFTFRP